MPNKEISAISPIDGRYANKVSELSPYFSEYALMKYRVLVEVEYFKALCQFDLPQLKVDNEKLASLSTIYTSFTEEDALAIKEIEKTINHDVKAVEYFVKDKLNEAGFTEVSEFVHFGLTSQDINNTAIPLSIKAADEHVLIPLLESVIKEIGQLAEEWKGEAMLARTHGQPASPTKLGKEIKVFEVRLQKQLEVFKNITHSGKFGGATGNFNAHHVAYPNKNWEDFANNFLKDIGLERQSITTQIEHYDGMAQRFDCLKRINTILIDMCRDVWTYISMDYFKQKVNANEVGSSAMPHKVNPIDFENAEGNYGLANALFEHLSAKLPISRLQRDLTDSTVTRNIGMPYGYTLIALKSTLKGLSKLLLNQSKLEADLENNWMVVAEAIQTVLRRENFPKPYEALKALTRNNKVVNQQTIHTFIDELSVNDELKSELKLITPSNYTGIY